METIKKIAGVNILNVELVFPDFAEEGCLDLGSVRLERDGRSYVWETIASQWYDNDDYTSVVIDLEVGIDGSDPIDVDSDFDLTADDMLAEDLKATIFIGELEELKQKPDFGSLFVEIHGESKTIDLTWEI